ncbi:ABC transporter permease [Streptosporangiaceae bacterium NEAU-GS5]|nr:ABC transporter permease [Streptosporangiaceae bacterium NEAU-GS5]
MSTHVVADSATMFRRNLLHMIRYPAVTIPVVFTPIVLLLLFVYVFGGTLGAGLGAGGGRAEYLAYITPAILLLANTANAQGIAISVATDMTEGIIARFRTMPISRSSVLAGHVFGGLVQSLIAMAASLVVSLLLGFRPQASGAGWIGLLALLVLISFAISWLSVAFGLAARSVESASNLPMLLLLLPVLSSGFVPVDSMPSGLKWFAEYQPFTPIIESIRGLFAGHVETSDLLAALIWIVATAVLGYMWARSLFQRRALR